MAIEVNRVVQALERWSQEPPAPQTPRSAKKVQRSPRAGAAQEDRLAQMLDERSPRDLDDHLERIKALLPDVPLVDDGRALSPKHCRPLLGRAATLQLDLRSTRAATQGAYAHFFPLGEPPRTAALRVSTEAFLRRGISRATLRAPAYEAALGPPAPGERRSLQSLSAANLRRLGQALGTVRPEEVALYERLRSGEMYFKHATDAAYAIAADQRMDSPLFGQAASGTTERNQKFHHRAYVFGRLELSAGPMARSRFGAATIQVNFDDLDPDVSISLRDQHMPFVNDKKEVVYNDIRVRHIEGNERGASWTQVYGDGDLRERVSFADEVFYGRDNCRLALARAMLLELRRMAGLGRPDYERSIHQVYRVGTELRSEALAAAERPGALATLMKAVFRVEIRVPGFLDLGARPYQVFHAAGAGNFWPDGSPDVAMQHASEQWRKQEKLLGRQVGLNKQFFAALTAACAPHLATLRDPRASAQARQFSQTVTDVWQGRVQCVVQAMQRADQGSRPKGQPAGVLLAAPLETLQGLKGQSSLDAAGSKLGASPGSSRRAKEVRRRRSDALARPDAGSRRS